MGKGENTTVVNTVTLTEEWGERGAHLQSLMDFPQNGGRWMPLWLSPSGRLQQDTPAGHSSAVLGVTNPEPASRRTAEAPAPLPAFSSSGAALPAFWSRALLHLQGHSMTVRSSASRAGLHLWGHLPSPLLCTSDDTPLAQVNLPISRSLISHIYKRAFPSKETFPGSKGWDLGIFGDRYAPWALGLRSGSYEACTPVPVVRVLWHFSVPWCSMALG